MERNAETAVLTEFALAPACLLSRQFQRIADALPVYLRIAIGSRQQVEPELERIAPGRECDLVEEALVAPAIGRVAG